MASSVCCGRSVCAWTSHRGMSFGGGMTLGRVVKLIGGIATAIALALAVASYFVPQFGQQLVSSVFPANKPNYSRLLSQNISGATVAYVESITGPAMRTDDHGRRTYIVDGCKIEILYDEDRVSSFGIHLTTACNIGWDSVRKNFNAGRHLPSANRLHFSDLFDQVGLMMDPRPCMTYCGNNGSGPVYSVYFGGSNSDNNQFFTFTRHMNTGTETPAEIDAAIEFGRRVGAELGGEWHQDSPETCDHDILSAARATLENLQVDYIEVGPAQSNRYAIFCDDESGEMQP
jgi:hypothetical protein